jgi:adenosylcobinamide-GDP ribazoletransferase
MSLRDGVLLSVGTLTRIPVPPPRTVDRVSGGVAMAFAPLAVAPLAVGLTVLLLAGHRLGLPPTAVGLLAVGYLAWATRMLHLDGISDTVDGWTASRDRERSLEVMRSGTAGPAGVVTLVVVLGLQAVALGQLSTSSWGAVTAGTAVVASRAALTLACTRGVPAARPDGLGAAVAGTVPPLVTAAVLCASWTVLWLAGSRWDAGMGVLLAPALSVLAVLACLRVAVRRLGGVTGDVLGAVVELSFTVTLVCVV